MPAPSSVECQRQIDAYAAAAEHVRTAMTELQAATHTPHPDPLLRWVLDDLELRKLGLESMLQRLNTLGR